MVAGGTTDTCDKTCGMKRSQAILNVLCAKRLLKGLLQQRHLPAESPIA